MTTSILDHDAMLNIFQKPHMPNTRPQSLPKSPNRYSDSADNAIDPVLALAIKHFPALMATDSDQRLDYVASANPEVTEAHVDQLATTTHNWLNAEACNQIRTIAQQSAQQHHEPHQVLQTWLNQATLQTFLTALDQTEFPDQVLATCYAVCRAADIAQAAFIISLGRRRPPSQTLIIHQTPDEVAEDLWFANAK